jgi:NTP pyrophosphatase (non-canonical NTP hydrolase)
MEAIVEDNPWVPHFAQGIQGMARQIMEDEQRWFGQEALENLTLQTLGLVGESGEFAEIIKKVTRGDFSLEVKLDDLKEELIDVLYYWLHIAALLQMDIVEEYFAKRAINDRRFGPNVNHREP